MKVYILQETDWNTDGITHNVVKVYACGDQVQLDSDVFNACNEAGYLLTSHHCEAIILIAYKAPIYSQYEIRKDILAQCDPCSYSKPLLTEEVV